MPLLALIVDDSMLIRHTIGRTMEKHGFRVEMASNGMAALEALKNFRPDVIFTDLQMPKLSGEELINLLKGNPETAGIPIVVVAAKPLSGDVQEERAHSVIYKDMNIEVQLKRVVESFFPGKSETAD
ncbi:MAG TPA: response regulator [Candidatus Angelobacter sp.]|nr:response regulator [Candidatus Angelobacter sp.]